MNKIICTNCGANDFVETTVYRICKYCGTKYAYNRMDNDRNSSTDLQKDIEQLLLRLDQSPAKADYYAKLILSIDGSNKRALEQLAKKKSY